MNVFGRVILFLPLFLNSFFTHSQMAPFLNRKDFDWSTWESIKDPNERAEFIQNLNPSEMQPGDKQLNDFLVMDIDADGRSDLLYKGSINNPTVIFYKNNQGGLKEILRQEGQLIYISRDKPWNPISFQILWADSIQEELQICSHAFKNGQLEFTLTNTIILDHELRVLKENLPPMHFQVKDSLAYLRSSPNPGSENWIKKFSLGEIGFAIGSEMNQKREIWWFVLMKEPGNKLRAGCMEPSLERSKISVWILSNRVVSEYRNSSIFRLRICDS